MNVKIITHYPEDDPKFYGDYASVEIVIDGEVVEEYGDYYHDKGQEKAEGFVDALNYCRETKFPGENLIIMDENVADYED